MKSAIDFQESYHKNKIKKWIIHNCVICNYPCGFLFEFDNVYYDNGCYCTYLEAPLRQSNFQEVADHYNLQTTLKVIEEYNEFWKF